MRTNRFRFVTVLDGDRGSHASASGFGRVDAERQCSVVVHDDVDQQEFLLQRRERAPPAIPTPPR